MIGDLVGMRYEIVQELESNPLFASFKAMDRQTGRDVRLRVLDEAYQSERKFVDALKQHAEAAKQLTHPGVERIMDVVDDGRPTIVTEYVQANPLEERIKRLASFSVQLALGTAIGVCEALFAVHQAGFSHGDVSGKNVLVTPSGSVKLAMTGFWSTYANSSKAGLAMLRGMAPYLAPEVTAGSMPSVASDIYAVGVLTYQMLAGRCPYSGDSTVAVATKHATAPFPSLRTLNSSVPEALDEVVRKCMAKSPDQRYKNVGELLSDLRGIQDALRFGRPLTWPVGSDSSAHNPVAPEVQEPEVKAKKTKVTRRAEPEESDRLPRFVLGLVYLAIIAAVLGLGGFVWFNTNKPKLIDLPNVVYRNQTEAATELDKLGLRMSVERHEASEKYPAGIVLSQDPLPGPNKVKERGIVQVVVSSGGRFVEVPDLRGRSLDEARTLLEAIDLDLSEDTERVRDRELAEGLIVSQIPEPRKKVERASRIKVKVSNGDKRVSTGTGSSERFVYRLKITMPPGAAPVMVRIDMTDDDETKTIHEDEHEPTDTFTVESEGRGKEAMFRVFFDGELVDQITKKADVAAKPGGEE